MKDQNIEKALKGWEKLINPKVLKANLMAVAAYLAAYEMLKNNCLVERARSFSAMDLTKMDGLSAAIIRLMS